MQMVQISGRTYCIVSYIASPAVTIPPGLLDFKDWAVDHLMGRAEPISSGVREWRTGRGWERVHESP